MAKRRRKKSKRSGSQRAKFRTAAHKCAAQVRNSGAAAFSRESWRQYGACMKKEL